MRLKSYFAESVEQAISRASKELGSEAMLVYSRESQAEARYLGSYEVVFSVPAGNTPELNSDHPATGGREKVRVSKAPAKTDQIQVPSAGAARVLPTTATARSAEELASWWHSIAKREAPSQRSSEGAAGGVSEANAVEKLSADLALMRRQMESMMNSLTRGVAPNSSTATQSSLMAALDPLLQAGVSEEIVRKVADKLGERPEGSSVTAGADFPGIPALRRELGEMFSVDPAMSRRGDAPRIVALVGPPGSGKTTTLAKLAVAYGLKGRKPVQLISMDTCRVGGADQLRSYAAILGVGFQALETPGSLAQALEEHRHKDLILIDTPGLSERDLGTIDDLALFLKSRKDVDTHLTLTPSMKSADLKRVVDRYKRFGPTRLLFTKLDETTSLGTLLNDAVRTDKPISFLTSGQRIPEDLEPATKDHVLDLILGSHFDASNSTGHWAVPVERTSERPSGRQAAAA